MDYLQYWAIPLFRPLDYKVLNLVINGLPSIPKSMFGCFAANCVLNLVINGLPSIQKYIQGIFMSWLLGFKPCYKWITFNTY